MENKTLNELLQEGIDRFTASEKPKEIIDNHIEKMFKDIINDCFHLYEDFGKSVKEAVKNALPSNINEIIELPKYNKLIAESLKNQWESAGLEKSFIEQANTSLQKIIDESNLPKFIKLSDLLNAFIEHHADEAQEEGWDRPDIRFEYGDNYVSGREYMHIYFDKTPKNTEQFFKSSQKNNVSLKYHLHLASSEQGDISEKTYKIYSASIYGDSLKSSIVQAYSAFEKMILAIYYGNSLLIVDCDENDFSYPTND